MTSDEFNQAKQIIKNTLSKRDGIGTGGQNEEKVFGSMNTQVNIVASVNSASKNAPVTTEQGQKTIGVLSEEFNGTGFTYPQQYEAIPGNFNLQYIQQICAALDNEKAASNGALDESSSCKTACSGLCKGSCLSFCNGCTSCTGSCAKGCTGGCGNGCSGNCASGCTNGCQGSCSGSCTQSCGGGSSVQVLR